MTITEKINRAKTDYDEVYNAGYEKGKGEGGTDAFWEAYQEGGKRKNYVRAFGNAGWTDVTFDPKYDMKPTNADHMFYLSNITKLECGSDKLVDFSEAASMLWLFRQCTKLKTVGDIHINENCTSIQYLFYNSNALEEVGTITMHEGVTNTTQAFQCTGLKKITFAGTINTPINFNYCTLLSAESIDSIIGALKQLEEDETAKTITFNPNIVLTEQQKADIDKKGWSLVQ